MRQSIGSVILTAGLNDPTTAAIIDGDGVLTRADLAEHALSLANALVDQGVSSEDTVVVYDHDPRTTVIACCAVWICGARPLPLDPSLAVPDTISPAMVLHNASAPVDVRPLPDATASSWKAVATSGSTGTPKIVAATAPALVDPLVPVATFLPRKAVQLVTAPLHRAAPFTYAFRGLFTGHTLILAGELDPAEWLSSIATHQVTWTMTSPAFLHRLMQLPEDIRHSANLSSLQTLLHIGAPCPVPLKQAILDWLGPKRVVEVYAGSESNGLTVICGCEWLKHPGSVGTASGGTEIVIRDKAGRDLPAGTIGEVWLRRGDTPAYQYLGGDSRRDAAGWDTLGDLGFLDDAGYLFVIDRAADVITRDGATIYPAQIEAMALQHPGVKDAVAFGIDGSIGLIVETDGDPPTIPGVDLIRAVPGPLRDAAGKTSRKDWSRYA